MSMAHDHGHAHEHAPSHAPAAVAHQHHPHRSLAEINRLIERSALSPAAQARAKELFHRLGEAEAAIHQMPVEKIHLHEVGALDSIIDIVGAVFALEWFRADRIVCSPLNVGGGMVNSAHGHFPVPAPATVKLLGGAPVYSSGVQSELVTPTGALLVTSYATSFGPVPAMTIERVGYGAGDRDLPNTPNVLRVLVGESTDQPHTERDRRDRVRDRRHEPADLRARHGSAVCGRRARGVLRVGADEEEPARHAADGARAARSSARNCRRSCFARPRPSACGITR